MDKILPTPYHAQGHLGMITINNFQFGYLSYLLKAVLYVLILFVPFFTYMGDHVANISAMNSANTANLGVITGKIVSLESNALYMKKHLMRKIKSMERLQISMEASIAAVETTTASLLVAALKTVVALDTANSLTVEYLPTIAGMDPTVKAIQIAVEATSGVVDDLAGDLTAIAVSTADAAVDLSALLAASIEYYAVMEPVVAVITGDLSAVVGDYFNPIFQLGGWHIRAIHSTVDVKVRETPLEVTMVSPNPLAVSVVNFQTPPNPYPVTVTNQPVSPVSKPQINSPVFLIRRLTPKNVSWRDRVLGVLDFYFPKFEMVGYKAVFVTGNFTNGTASFYIDNYGQITPGNLSFYDLGLQCKYTSCFENWHENSTLLPFA